MSNESEVKPPFGSKRAAALALYEPPFKFMHGYIYDSKGNMVADQDGIDGAVESHVAARVRGWGRIGYMPEPEALQDEVGAILAEALTQFWQASRTPAQAVAGAVANYTDWQQRRGVFADMVDEAIASYDSWMLDDDYDTKGSLDRIIGRLCERRAMYRDEPVAAPPAALLEQAIEALESARNGLQWYQDAYPQVANGCDDEANELIDTALSALEAHRKGTQ